MGSGKGREGKASLSRQTRPVSSSPPECTDSDYFTYYHYLASLLSAPCICRRINHSLTHSFTHSHTPTLPQSFVHSLSLTPSAIDNNSDGVGTDQGMNRFKRLISTLPQGQTDTCRVYLQCEI